MKERSYLRLSAWLLASDQPVIESHPCLVWAVTPASGWISEVLVPLLSAWETLGPPPFLRFHRWYAKQHLALFLGECSQSIAISRMFFPLFSQTDQVLKPSGVRDIGQGCGCIADWDNFWCWLFPQMVLIWTREGFRQCKHTLFVSADRSKVL